MQCYTRDSLIHAFSTPLWHEIVPTIRAYSMHSSDIPQHCSVDIYKAPFPHSIAHYKNCCILYSTQAYTIHLSHTRHDILIPYSHETDTIHYTTVPEYTKEIAPETYCILPTKTIYSITPSEEAMTITAFFIPHYLLRQGEHTIEIQCFSMLQSFLPLNATTYPIELTWTLHDVIDSLGIEHDVVRIVFVNNKATHKSELVRPQTKITLFPGIGGG